LNLQSTAATAFKYDDILLVNYNNTVLMASDRRVAGYAAGASPDSIGTTPVNYTWPNILNQDISNQAAQGAWCSTGATSCTVPPTETTGSLVVNIPDFRGEDALNYPSAPDARTFTLVTIGDNDDGTFNSGFQTTDTDCVHGAIQVQLTLTTEPAPPPPPKDQYFTTTIDVLASLHNGCTSQTIETTPGYSRACIAAAHRFCLNNGYEGGMITERLLPTIGINCFRGKAYSAVDISALTALHGACNSSSIVSTQEYTYACNAAASRYCTARGYGSGILQEILLPSTWVTCVDQPVSVSYKPGIPFTTWSAYHDACAASMAGAPDVTKACRAAARRYCAAAYPNGGSGLPVEWGSTAEDFFCTVK